MDNSLLFCYQGKDVDDLSDRVSGVLTEPIGGGKTVILMSFIDRLWEKGQAGKVLIVAPNAIIRQWCGMIREWMGLEALPVFGGKGTKNRQFHYANFMQSMEYDIMLVNYSTVVSDYKILVNLGLTAVFFDEISYLQNRYSKASRAARILASNIRLAFGATGALIQNNLIEFYSVVEVLNKSLLPEFEYFKARYCIEELVEVHTRRGTVRFNKITGHKNLHEIQPLIDQFCIANGTEEIIDKLPHVHVLDYEVELNKEQAAHYRDLKAGVLDTPYGIRRVEVLEKMVRMFEVCDSLTLIGQKDDKSAKMDEVERLVLNEMAGTPVIIFSLFKKVLKSFRRRFEAKGLRVVSITGDDSIEVRDDAQEKINTGVADVLLLTTAGGTGLNLQGARAIIMMDRHLNPAMNQQIIGRINRIGQKSPTIAVINIIAKDTVDEYVFKVLTQKVELANALFTDRNVNPLGIDELKCVVRGEINEIEDKQEYTQCAS